MAAGLRAALQNGHRALASGDAGAKAQAARALLALPEQQQTAVVAKLLAALGANHDALRIATRIATTSDYPGPSLLWDQRMRGTLDDPDFPALATQLGLMRYWQTSRTRPDVCDEKAAPAFCAML
jgi:hypothetical protein